MPKSVSTDVYVAVVEYLIVLRKTRRMSQFELALRLGKSQQFVSVVERRIRRIDIVEFLVWVRALEADTEAAVLQVARSLPEDVAI